MKPTESPGRHPGRDRRIVRRAVIDQPDVEWSILTTEAGRCLLEDIGPVERPGPSDLTRWRKAAPPEWVAAALSIAETRRRAHAKFRKAETMWLDPVGLEQATAEPVARHKAARFGSSSAVVDLCSGIGGDALALAADRPVIAVDRDPAMARRLLWNASIYGVSDRLLAVRGDAARFGLPQGAWVHIDPDRRASGDGRARSLAGYEPGPRRLLELTRAAPGGAIKLGPASDFSDHFDAPGLEIEVTSLAGECKEATVWFGAAATCRRRATVLPAEATWTDRDAGAESARLAPIAPLARWVFEPDPSLVRAGLLDGFARVHGLARFAPGVDLLTGPNPSRSPFLVGFEVLDTVPFDIRRVRRMLDDRGIGRPEIKVRGLSALPEEVLRKLKRAGPVGGTLILVGGHGPSQAILAARMTSLPTQAG